MNTHSLRLALLGLVSLLATSCGSASDDDEVIIPENDEEACALVDGCDAPARPVAGPRTPLFRLLIVRDAEGVRIEKVDQIEVSQAIGAPVGPSGGTYALGALNADGELLEAQLLAFPDTMEFEFEDRVEEVDMSDEPASVIAYVAASPEIASFGVMDADGDIVVDLPLSEASAAPAEYERASSALIQASEGGACEHVMVLNGAEDAAWNPDPTYPTLAPTPTQLAVIRATLGRLTPLHCAGVGRIVIVQSHGDDEDEDDDGTRLGGWNNGRYGDAIFINERLEVDGVGIDEVDLQTEHSRALLAGVVAHEAAHALVSLLRFARNVDPFAGDWVPTKRTLATETLDHARLAGDFDLTWGVLHQSFVFRGWASDYYGNAGALAEASVEDVTSAGFMSHYAAQSTSEDIAEYIAWPIVDRLYEEAGVASGPGVRRRGYACQELRAYDQENIPSRLAAAYTKLSFLRSLGAIHDEDFEHCVGESVGLGDNAIGVTVMQGGMQRRIFDQSIMAGIGNRDGRYLYTMSAEGGAMFGDELYPATVQLELDLGPMVGLPFDPTAERPIERVSWPRGAFDLSGGTFDNFTLRLEGAEAGNFDVTEGFALVTRADNDTFEGSVFVTEAFRFQAPVPVPQVFDPPLIFRIRLEN